MKFTSGLGKTTAARLIFQELGYISYEYSHDDYVETNKKDQYAVFSEKGIEEILYKLLLRNQAFGKFGILLDGVGAGAVALPPRPPLPALCAS